jgi:FAD/FMN-containing dehydrogenase
VRARDQAAGAGAGPFDGSISAEHGIGLVKKGYLDSTRGPAEIALMKAVKRAFDPQARLNPGKLFDV